MSPRDQALKKQTPKTRALTTAGVAALALATLAGASPPALAGALTDKADAALAARMAAPDRGGAVSAIVRTAGPLSAAQEAQVAALGGVVTARLPIIESVTVSLPARRLRALAALPFVTRLSYDGQVRKSDAFTTGSSGASSVWSTPSGAATQGVNGAGVGIAVVDSGIQQGQQDFRYPTYIKGLPGSSRVLTGVSFAVNAQGGADNDAMDHCGHGTHVAGIIAGSGNLSYGAQYTKTYMGVAPLSNIVNVRVLDANGGGTVSGVLAGIQWAIVNRNAVVDKVPLNIRVINLSLGHPVGESYRTDPLCQAVEAAWRAGIVVVCAAGNEGRANGSNRASDSNEGWGTAYGSIQSPANDPYVITVGATKRATLGTGAPDMNRAHDKIATYSSRGPSRLDLVCKPDILAPGNKVVSLDAGGTTLDRVTANRIPLSAYSTVQTKDADAASKNYFVLSGTSMACPVVAGAAALLLQKDPTLTPDTVKARLMLSADKWADSDGTADPCTYGAGYLNIPAALGSTATVSGEYAVSPSLSIDPAGSVTVNDDHALWGKTTVDSSHALWGSRALWGSGGVTDLNALWGSHALWGKSTLASSHALWGSSVWSDHALWGSSIGTVDLTSTAINGE